MCEMSIVTCKKMAFVSFKESKFMQISVESSNNGLKVDI